MSHLYWMVPAAFVVGYVVGRLREAHRARESAPEHEPVPGRIQMVPADVHERGWQWRPTGDDTAFAPPFGTVRICRVCGCLVAGGPTACVHCAEAGA